MPDFSVSSTSIVLSLVSSPWPWIERNVLLARAPRDSRCERSRSAPATDMDHGLYLLFICLLMVAKTNWISVELENGVWA